MLHEEMPLIVSNGSLELRGRLFWTMAMVLLRRKSKSEVEIVSQRLYSLHSPHSPHFASSDSSLGNLYCRVFDRACGESLAAMRSQVSKRCLSVFGFLKYMRHAHWLVHNVCCKI